MPFELDTTNEKVYYMGLFLIKCGEYEFDHYQLFKLDQDESPELHMNGIASSMYDSKNISEDDGGWYYNGSEIFVKIIKYSEISRSTFDELKSADLRFY
jgi:hypothetical protein